MELGSDRVNITIETANLFVKDTAIEVFEVTVKVLQD